MTLNLVVQGFLCSYLALNMMKNSSDGRKGMACVVAAVIVALGATYGLGVGILLWIIVDHDWMKSTKLKTLANGGDAPPGANDADGELVEFTEENMEDDALNEDDTQKY